MAKIKLELKNNLAKKVCDDLIIIFNIVTKIIFVIYNVCINTKIIDSIQKLALHAIEKAVSVLLLLSHEGPFHSFIFLCT